MCRIKKLCWSSHHEAEDALACAGGQAVAKVRHCSMHLLGPHGLPAKVRLSHQALSLPQVFAQQGLLLPSPMPATQVKLGPTQALAIAHMLL